MRRAIALVLLPILVAALGCGPRQVPPDDRAAIESVLSTYAERMAEAYRTGDATRLAEVATGREQARVERTIAELAAEGKELRPKLQSLAVELIDPAGRTSVVATTLEVWDLTVLAAGSEREVSRSLAQENHLTYSLVREGGRWLVLSRTLRSTQAPS